MVQQLDVYARVSRLGDDRQRSIEGQVAECLDRVAALGAQVGEIHDQDKGRSAWNPRASRPGWDRLMARLESGDTGGVIVFDLARFSRRPIEGERLIDAAERGLLVLDSENEYDLTSPSGKLAFRNQLDNAAYESDRLSTRVKRGKRLKAMRGEPNGSTRAFGFNDDDTIREAEAGVLRDLAGRLLAGESQDAMIVELNARGVLTATGGHWTRPGLRQVLTRPRNAGYVVHQGVTVARMPGAPILDEETWQRVCSLYAARRRGRPVSDAYLCSGIVCCGLCRHRLSGRPRANMAPYPDGSVRRQYWCQPRSHDGGCGRISVDQRELDRHLAALVIRVLADPRHAATVEAAAEQRREAEAEIIKAEELAEQLADRLGRGEIPLARYDKAVAPLDRRLDQLRAALAELDTAGGLAPTEGMAAASRAEWEQRWNVASVAEQRSLLRMALRGRRLLVMPGTPSRFDPARIVIEEAGR